MNGDELIIIHITKGQKQLEHISEKIRMLLVHKYDLRKRQTEIKGAKKEKSQQRSKLFSLHFSFISDDTVSRGLKFLCEHTQAVSSE